VLQLHFIQGDFAARGILSSQVISTAAVAHTFLLVNGCDLELEPLAAYEFMIQSIAGGVPFRPNPRVDHETYSPRIVDSIGAVRLLDKMELADQFVPAILELAEARLSDVLIEIAVYP